MHNNFIKPLIIKWNMAYPPVKATTWVRFYGDNIKNTEPESLLNLSPGTIEILNKAFAMNLSRETGWIIDKKQLIDAARIYKRGVEYKPFSNDNPYKEKGSYNIEFYSDIEKLKSTFHSYNNEYVFIIDNNLFNSFKDFFPENSIVINTNETRKNLFSVSEIIQKCKKFDKWIIAGGGVLSDIASFAAYLLNKEFIFLPSTLLAMVDACIGGKTGVNFPPYGKNQIGAFYFPQKVLICKDLLNTLPQRQLLSGLNECIKHYFIGGINLHISQNLSLDDLKKIINVKAKIINSDPGESGYRSVLNLGHGLAHALEGVSLQNNPTNILLHGEAVGIGLLFALLLSNDLALFSPDNLKKGIDILKTHGYLLSKKELNNFLGSPAFCDQTFEKLYVYMMKDKKNISTNTSWVLLNDFGIPFKKGDKYTVEISKDILKKTYVKLETFLD